MLPEEDIIFSKYLQKCGIPIDEFSIGPFTMAIFGGAGDLSRRKLMPSIFNLYCNKELYKGFSVVGVDMREMDDNQYRSMMKDAVREFSEGPFDEDQWYEFIRHVYYLTSKLENDDTYERVRKKIDQVTVPASNGLKDVIYYLAVPPGVAPLVVGKLKEHDLCKGPFNTKVIVEKPFGVDRKSAVALNRTLTGAFKEEQIYRIDHYLGKETVQNILFFRSSNAIFEQFWNHQYIDNVQITVAEDIGIEHRGEFYEQSGVVRDIVQSHVMQLLGMVAMELPTGFKADFIRDEKVKVLRSIREMDNAYIDAFTVSGQYGPGKIKGQDVPGYRQEQNVSPASNVPTFFAGKFYIDNLRWGRVPFYVRTGKRLPRRVTEICIQFKRLPLRLLGRDCDAFDPNILILTIQPDERISLRLGVKYPYSHNQLYSVSMTFNYRETFKTGFSQPYELLLADCIKGDLTLFVREDGIEEMWGIVDPVTARWESFPVKQFPNYGAGTWGPPEALKLLEQDGRSWITD
ncbi:MAG: glucose-6-phosphate dehydrogenase [Nitrospiraceae bacterium]|nr:MAG: glucose-6-phosphate dehydrogenase [Nitrospiraceae bacterium]